MPYTEVMHKFKRGTLRSSNGRHVASRKQAIAIMLSEKRAATNGKTEYQPKGSAAKLLSGKSKHG